MIYNEKRFLKAIANSFAMYKLYGARSTKKLKPLHYHLADLMQKIWGNDFAIHYLGENVKELKVAGKYYDKYIDITVTDNKRPIFCVGIKFVTSNYKQNATNYFESMMGETANIQVMENLPYAQIIILRHQTPYYQKNNAETPSKIEIINDKDIKKYLNLMFNAPQAHRPICLGIQLIDIDEKSGGVTPTKLRGNFSDETIKLLNEKLSPTNFFTEIIHYRDYYQTKK